MRKDAQVSMITWFRDIRHAIRWRKDRYSPIIREVRRSTWAQLRVEWRWHSNPRRRPHRLPANLVVSLTSYPSRFDTLSHTLRSLLCQTIKADHTILWITHSEMPLLPKNITALQAAGLEIRAADNIKSYNKIFPALDAFPDAFICTADDDLYYWPTWLEELVEGAQATDRIVTCHNGHEIAFDSYGGFKPYAQWRFNVRQRGELNRIFPTGGSGILYPPGILAHTAEDREAAINLCPRGDDIWLYWIGQRNGAIYKLVGRWREFVAWRGSQTNALWHSNILQGGNDDQIRKMMARYGYPHRRVENAGADEAQTMGSARSQADDSHRQVTS